MINCCNIFIKIIICLHFPASETISTTLSQSSSTTTKLVDDIIKPSSVITEAINDYNNHDNNDSYRTIIKTINNNYNNYEKPTFSSFTQYPTSSPQMQRPIMQSTASPSPSSPLVDRIIEEPSVNSKSLSYSRLINVNSNVNRYSLDRRQQRAVPPEYSEMPPQCETFVTGDPEKKTLYSPNYPNNYPNNTDCVLVLEGKELKLFLFIEIDILLITSNGHKKWG